MALKPAGAEGMPPKVGADGAAEEPAVKDGGADPVAAPPNEKVDDAGFAGAALAAPN